MKLLISILISVKKPCSSHHYTKRHVEHNKGIIIPVKQTGLFRVNVTIIPTGSTFHELMIRKLVNLLSL